MKKTAKIYLDKKVLSQWESDLRRMTKIYRSIPTDPARTWKYGEMFDNPNYEKNLQAWEEAQKLFSRYERNIQDLVYDEILPGPEKEKTWQERALREKAWGFITDIRSSSLFDRSYHYLTDKHEPDLPKLGKVRDTNVRRYQKSAREFFEALEDWLALKGGSHVSNRIEQMNLAGFQVRLYDATGSERNIAFVKAGLEKYRERAQAYAPILIQNQVPINIYPNKSHGDAEASYDWGTKTISLWEWATISSRNINRLVWVLAHEMGHHVFKTALNNRQKDLWERVIKGDYKDLDLREVIKKMRSGEDISDFIQRIKNEDPILQLQLETLWYNPSVKDLELFSIRDIVEYLEKGGNPMVRVPATPITQYAAKNPEEAFCEAIGVLVGLGPRGLHEKVRALLRIMIPSIRIATQKGEVRTILASTNEPTDPKLWDKVQALTKGEIKSLRHDGKTIQGPNDGKGFRIFPSAYSNGWSSKIYKDLGGKWRKSKTARGGLDEWFSGHDDGDNGKTLTRTPTFSDKTASLDENLVKGLRIWVKKTFKVKNSYRNFEDLVNHVKTLRDKDLNRLWEYLFYNKGLLPHVEYRSSNLEDLRKKVKKELEESRKKLGEFYDIISGTIKSMTPETDAYKMDHLFNQPEYTILGFYKARNPEDPFGEALKGYLPDAKKTVSEVEKILSGKMLRAITDFLNELPGIYHGKPYDTGDSLHESGEILLDYNIGKMKLVYDGHIPKDWMNSADPRKFPKYIEHFRRAKALLEKKGFGHVWYGPVFIGCPSCGGENQHGSHFGVGARYHPRKDNITIFMEPTQYVADLLVHELGHRYYFKFMGQEERLRFNSYFKEVAAVSVYGGSSPEEDFAEVFTHFVLGKDLTRDQIERFKAFLAGDDRGKTARGKAKKDVGQGGLDEWFSGHGGDEGDATWGDWVAITPIKHKVDDKTYEPGDIVGPCGISSDAAWKEITNNGKDPLKCMPRNKAHDMPKENRAELAKEKQKAEEEGSNRGKKPTNTPTFSEEADELLEKSARMKRADSRSDAEKDAIFSKWKDLINMTEKELNSWAKDPNRLEASLSRDEAEDLSKSKKDKIQSGYDSLHRIKRRVSKPQQEWSDDDYDNAAQENGFNQRMIGNKPGDPIGDTGMSKWEISLRNWGHDPSKASSPAHSKWKSWSRKNKLKMASTSRDSMRNNVAGNRSILTTHAGSNMNLSKIAQRVAAKKLENNLSRPVIKKINAAIDKAGLTGRLMFPGSRAGWAKVFEVLGDFGVTTDTIPYISGPSGDIRIFLRWINDEESEIDNTVLVFTWHKQQSEKYEILAYLS